VSKFGTFTLCTGIGCKTEAGIGSAEPSFCFCLKLPVICISGGGVGVLVAVGVFVRVGVRVFVGVLVGVNVGGILVGVRVGVLVGVIDGAFGVEVGQVSK